MKKFWHKVYNRSAGAC